MKTRIYLLHAAQKTKIKNTGNTKHLWGNGMLETPHTPRRIINMYNNFINFCHCPMNQCFNHIPLRNFICVGVCAPIARKEYLLAAKQHRVNKYIVASSLCRLYSNDTEWTKVRYNNMDWYL